MKFHRLLCHIFYHMMIVKGKKHRSNSTITIPIFCFQQELLRRFIAITWAS